MKTLDEIEKDITELKDRILCQEVGNDSYYLSPLYHEQLLMLHALENEAAVLKGKSLPIKLDFEKYPPDKQIFLKNIVNEKGLSFAHNYKDLSADELNFLWNLIKKSHKNKKNTGH